MSETKYTVKATSQFRKDYKPAVRRGPDISPLDEAITLLSTGAVLPDKYRDHALTGNRLGHRECRILPDWLLIYRLRENTLVLTLTRTGTHSDLPEK